MPPKMISPFDGGKNAEAAHDRGEGPDTVGADGPEVGFESPVGLGSEEDVATGSEEDLATGSVAIEGVRETANIVVAATTASTSRTLRQRAAQRK